MKIYLAGPMRGYPDFNYPAFHEAAARLREQGHIVFNPAETGDPKHWTIRDYMAVDLAWICHQAEGIALLPGWEKSTGALAEYHTALAIGLHLVKVD